MIKLPDQYKSLPTFSFGDSPQMANSGLHDVIAKRQVATCGAYELLAHDENTMPHEGKVEIVLDGKGQPGCAIQFWKVDVKRFNEIDEQFARDEACHDLEEWQTIHEAYFRRKNCFAPDMKIFLLYVKVIEVFKR